MPSPLNFTPIPVVVPDTPLWLELCVWTVQAGFPSSAADSTRKRIDLNEHLIRNKEATFIFRVKGDSMNGIGIYEGDELLVDRSIEAKALGVKMGAPWFECKALAEQHGILAMSSNYALYADMSNRVMNILSEFSPRTEVYSIDECFVDLTGMPQLRELSYHMRERVGMWTGMPVCVGIGPTKTLAKLANHVAKKHPRSLGVFNYNALTAVQKNRLLQCLPVQEVWGVGRKLSQKLVLHGVLSAHDLREARTPMLRAEFGVVMEKNQRELQETACLSLQEVPTDKQQIISSRSFGSMVTDLPVLKDALSMFVANGCAKLRAQGSHARVIQVFLQTNRFRKDLPQYMPSLTVPLPYPTHDTLEVNRWADYLCERMFKPGYAYKKAGVMLSEITPVSQRQGDLLEPETTSNTRLMQAVDTLNQRYGRGAVKVSTQGTYKDWQMLQARKSPHYTTDWQDLPMV